VAHGGRPAHHCYPYSRRVRKERSPQHADRTAPLRRRHLAALKTTPSPPPPRRPLMQALARSASLFRLAAAGATQAFGAGSRLSKVRPPPRSHPPPPAASGAPSSSSEPWNAGAASNLSSVDPGPRAVAVSIGFTGGLGAGMRGRRRSAPLLLH
jgi:hypothetical protein